MGRYSVKKSVDIEGFEVWHIYSPEGGYVAEAQREHMANRIVELANESL